MKEILVLAGVDDSSQRMADENQSRRLLEAVFQVCSGLKKRGGATPLLCFMRPEDALLMVDQVAASPSAPELFQTSDDLARIDGVLVIPPLNETFDPPHRFVADALNHCMKNEKLVCVCHRTTLGMRWMLQSEESTFVCDDILESEKLYEVVRRFEVS